jgi:hypothetical protein
MPRDGRIESQECLNRNHKNDNRTIRVTVCRSLQCGRPIHFQYVARISDAAYTSWFVLTYRAPMQCVARISDAAHTSCMVQICRLLIYGVERISDANAPSGAEGGD